MHPRLLPTLLLAAALLPSCAYMQTYKNVREQGRSFRGYQLEKPREIYKSGGEWFIAASPTTFRRHHDAVHDNVFRQTNAPTMQPLATNESSPAYHTISPHTAAVLLRRDGYVESTSLTQEIKNSPEPWLDSLPQATTHEVKAEVVGQEMDAITYEPTPAEPSLGYRILGGLNLAFVDVPGTIGYNVAVPFVAPFVFFHEFLND